MGNSTITGATPILQPVTIDLEGSPFCVTCNSSTNLSFLFILGFLWLRESLLNFDHPNNKILFTCNDVVKLLPLVSGTLCPIPFKLNLTTISSTIPDTLSAKDKDGLPYCYSDFKDFFSEEECNLLPPHRPYHIQINLKPGTLLPGEGLSLSLTQTTLL
ncbi:retrotransposon-like protein 1 [Entomophthora muscae]|uniref:Retrotransposon-like protein 1 n=1 Tax=Entomophthora muscae TaxID=34485 RepID=A0ACC2UFB9_9FUNG|nr:retrotransposon-like protein 1 [Entomophthora muscae]